MLRGHCDSLRKLAGFDQPSGHSDGNWQIAIKLPVSAAFLIRGIGDAVDLRRADDVERCGPGSSNARLRVAAI
jgi:hypothetical protein